MSHWERRVPSMLPKMGSIWKQVPISRTLPTISFRVPNNGALLQVPLTELTQRERDTAFPDPSFNRLLKSLVNMPHSGSLIRPYGESGLFPKPFSYP